MLHHGTSREEDAKVLQAIQSCTDKELEDATLLLAFAELMGPSAYHRERARELGELVYGELQLRRQVSAGKASRWPRQQEARTN